MLMFQMHRAGVALRGLAATEASSAAGHKF